MKFKPGDVVCLNSGGPSMTVEEVSERTTIGGEAVYCVWFEKVGNKQVVNRDAFPPVTLKAVPQLGSSTGRIVRG